jgi:hypothetical protein
LSDGLNKAKEIKMKIKELLNDDQLYEIWLLLSDVIWEALIANYSNVDVAEGYRYRGPVNGRKAVIPAKTRQAKSHNRNPPPIVPVRPFPIRPELKAKQPASPPSKSNPEVDPLKGFNAQLDNRNITPLLSKRDIEIAMRNRPNGR